MMILAGIGGIFGFTVALFMRRQSLLLAIVFSFVVGTVLSTLFLAVGQAMSDVYPPHHSVVDVAEAVLGGVVYCGFFTPFACGLPAAFFGYITHRLLYVRKKPSA